MMLKTNQNGGFDWPGCDWGDSPESGMVKFCENGAKAVNWEATKRRVDGAFFKKHSVTSLLEQSDRSEEHTSELQSLVRISYAVFCLKKKKERTKTNKKTYKLRKRIDKEE